MRDEAAYNPELLSITRPATREWLALPEWCRHDLAEYVKYGRLEEETTLHYALCNDFRQTVCVAGADMAGVLRELAVALYCYTPGACHGSPAKVAAWCQLGGLRGVRQVAGGGRACHPALVLP